MKLQRFALALAGALSVSMLGAVAPQASAALPCDWNLGSQPWNYPIDDVARTART